jgi:plasmid stability protein
MYTCRMPSILIKDIPDEMHRQLREAAARDHRSLNKEVIALLETALAERPVDLPPPLELAFPLTKEWLERAISEERE